MSDSKENTGRKKDGKFDKGNEISIGNNGGAPTKYKEEYNEQALKLALLGATDEQMANFFGVEERTINNWKIDHAEFFQSIKKGKEEADIAIATSLFQKAKGFSKEVTKAFKLRTTKVGEGSTERIETAKEELYYPPDTTAIIFWLKNRQPEIWRDSKTLKGDKDNPIAIEQITGMVIK